jgi:hypothetical protein
MIDENTPADGFNADDEDELPGKVINTPPKRKAAPVVLKEPYVWIILEEPADNRIPPTGQFIGLQGRTWYLKPGVKAFVPEALCNVLNDAVESVPVVDPDSLKVTHYRDRLRFPYRLVKAPTAAELATP